jgi:hypothetical protein
METNNNDVGGLTPERIVELFKQNVGNAWSNETFNCVGFARAIEREVLATRASADVGGLTRYSPSVAPGGVAAMMDNPHGSYVKFTDVQALLATLPAHQAAEPVGIVTTWNKGGSGESNAIEPYGKYQRDERGYSLAAALPEGTLLYSGPPVAAHQAVAAEGAPEGWKLVPVEPTDAMSDAAMATESDNTYASYETIYRAMVASAPSPKSAASQGKDDLRDIWKEAKHQAEREKVRPEYRLVMLRQHAHEAAERFDLANECAAIRYDLERIAETTVPPVSTAEQAKAQQIDADLVELVAMAANSILFSHRLTNLTDADGDPYNLIDYLSSPERGGTIAQGKDEIEIIVDAICAIAAAHLARQEQAGAVAEGWKQAAAFIEKKAQDYINEYAENEHDTGAVVWRYGDAGHDYYNSLVELAEELRLASPAQASVPQAERAEVPTDQQQARAAGRQKDPYGPDNPPRLRKPGESVEDYRIAMGWDQPKGADAAQEAEQMGGAQAGLADRDLYNESRKAWTAASSESRASDDDEPTEVEQVIACLGDDAATLEAANPGDEMAQTMRDAARLLGRLLPSAAKSVDTPELRRLLYTLSCTTGAENKEIERKIIAHITSLIEARVAGVRKDAERYRWLRFADLDALAAVNWGNGGEVYEGEKFDAAIDAAMDAQSPASGSQEGGE